MRRIFLLALLPLVACASPQEQCIANATKDLRVLNKLIAVSQANVDRGYAIEVQEYIELSKEVCGEVDGEKVYCEVPETKKRKVPVAIDLNIEQAKLNSLLTKRSQLSVQAEKQIAACKTAYPET